MKRLLPLFAFAIVPVFAANHYVRSGASGNGTDWANACGDFTGTCAVSSLVRGDTYYVAGGKYAGRTWNTPNSGTSVITVKHATSADHGTNTGWSDAYSSQASFHNRNTFSTNYWVFDGVSGDYATGGTGSYGFQFAYDIGNAGAQILGNYVTLRYIDCAGYTGTGDYNYPGQAKCIEAYGGNNWTVSHLAMHGCESCLQGGGNGWTVEHSYIYNSRSIASNWHNNIFYCSSANNSTFRYNRVWDYNAEGFFITGYSGQVSNIAIYGNVFSGTGSESNYPRGVEIRQDYSYSGILMYNNTCSNLSGGCIADRTPETGNTCAGCQAMDNVSYRSTISLGSAIAASNNTDDNTNRFVNVSGGDFHLTAPLSGVSLASTYSTDMDGNTRGGNGVWDRGAYEFGGGPQPPAGLMTSVK
jgi:hypothetical protein